MNRLSRSGLLSNDLDSSNDIFEETPEASPLVRGFRQPLKSTPTTTKAASATKADFDLSNHIFVGETPETSPTARTGDSQTGPSRRIPSDPTDSGISDSGTKSKSVTPESRFTTPATNANRMTTPGSRFMTPRSNEKYRSPQIIYESGSESDTKDNSEEAIVVEDSDAQSDTDASGYQDESEVEENDSEEEEVSGFDRKKSTGGLDETEESMLVIKKKSRVRVILSDEEDESSRRIDSTRDLLSEDSDDDQPIINKTAKGMGSPRKRNQIISSDESSDDENSGFRNKNSLVSDDSQPINKNRKGRENDKGDISRLLEQKATIVSSDEESETYETPPQGKRKVYSGDISITPPPESDESGPDTPHQVPRKEQTRTSENINFGAKPKLDKKVNEVVTVSSDSESDEVQVVGEQRKSKYTPDDIAELEGQIKRLKNSILVNNNMANTAGRRLPDGGASLRRTVQQDSIEMEKLRGILANARADLYQSSGGVFQPQKPSMMKSISGSSLAASRQFSGSNLAAAAGMGRSVSGSSLSRNISGSSLAGINESPQSKLERCKKKKQELQNALKFSARLSDGGDILREKIRKNDEEMAALEKEIADDPYVIDNELNAEIPTNNYMNSAYQSLKESLFKGSGASYNDLNQVFGTGPQQHLYGGRMTNSRQREARSVTHEAMEKLHKALETMPAEGDMEEQPKLLKSKITLFPHQRQALAWLLWREHQAVAPGGILADDMGLGKTLTMISLILKHNELEEMREKDEEEKENAWHLKGVGDLIKTKTTLIICPASLIGQWDNEIKNKVKSGVLRALVYHGPKARNCTAREMARYDVIITTYGTILSEVKTELGDSFKETKKLESLGAAEEVNTKSGKILSLAFERIILDEAHAVRNPRSLQSQAVCKLRARRRWAVTGTPIQNKELDLFSLIRFLRCSPFDEYQAWKKWVENKSAQSIERMNHLVKSLVLRRTKDQKSVLTGKVLVELPDKNIKTHEITLSEEEKKVYLEVEKFGKSAMTRFMDQGDEDEVRREVGLGGGSGISISGGGNTGDSEFAFQPYGDDEKVKAHHLLTLLLRMRQICCHPGLIKGMLDQEIRATEGIEEEGEDIDLISKLEDMTINKEEKQEEDSPAKILQMGNPVFKESSVSSKISTVVAELKRLREKAETEEVHEKAVVVSQWTSMLNILKHHIIDQGLKFTEITGQVNISTRGDIVENFNNNKKGPQIMLLSLAAGGVGLNLVGANHLFLLDMHWNPQLERQACDRIYRVGQIRDVCIHKFLVKETVEERIHKLQNQKLKLADDVLSGTKKRGANQLSLDDLKSLFGVV